MLGRLRNSFAEISLGALEQNFNTLKLVFPKEKAALAMAPMVKSDGYGHGDIQVARVFERLGARYLGVALVEEGIRLREAGIQTPILVFSTLDSVSAEAVVRYRLTPVLSQPEQVSKLKMALHEQASYPVHIKFNTGMQRLGFEPDEVPSILSLFEQESYLKLEGVCTHFASAEDFLVSNGMTQSQIKVFGNIAEKIKLTLRAPVLFHYLNTAAILTNVTPRLDLARPGLGLYGAVPHLLPGSNDSMAQSLIPVLTLKSFVGFIHKIKKGEKVSYGGTWEAKKDSLIAVIPIGYGDGYPRILSNKSSVLIRGERCPIAGTICMDYITTDVTELAAKNRGPVLGDEVVLIGRQKQAEIRAEELAELAGTAPYEILTGLQSRLPRVYIH